MKAIYRGQVCWLGPELDVATLYNERDELVAVVDFGDPELIVDPTDDEVAAALGAEDWRWLTEDTWGGGDE